MSKEQFIALDLRRYDTPQKLASLNNDTASLVIEASNTGNPRVNPHHYIKRERNKVIAPGIDRRDVSEMFVRNDPLTPAGEEIRKLLLEDTENFAYVWISPPNPWPETRIDIGAKRITKSKKFEYFESYGISTTLSKDDCLKLGQLLVSVSSNNYLFPQNLDDLKSIVIKLEIPPEKDPFSYLSEIIKLPEKEIFQSILDGTAVKNKAKALKKATIVNKPIMKNLSVIYSNPFEYGAYIETEMEKAGFGMNLEKSGCGKSNITLLNTNGLNTETQTLAFGYSDEYGSLEFPCPSCGATNRRPSGQLISNCQNCGANVRC
ncbi:hypothetical protein A2422_03785 [Candidatus Woesebacteria bacterium RIFOXYC1_FULL_31_51]|uniref:Uncharacterized protein n=1 Tax=Candidatus Woesebacteria bacterium GW2011_GWC2_31_9 TaxID=1618586 RepID=A0A0G0AYS8_9BACT|nr:MAG: hypothetical protein UR17_C0001G0345 [Candidatus Woesebacteria bacterium GW2011_GWF1_31_35]KKP23164.1 MAG: hypothetical protein UR11_C0001G0138 [Candidatus Woesebacteria bacterium GW2011_GWC1_30_29]KKP26852.1 MAG: hypothetical protein UR13_C0002G0087 [Candidatus Woesebacteria bacterium GW2011_GWD1_31_12]KKP27426.1 MAG: hypothetical protein UR16_C0003G0086 [Candidatus Woesebacteria bacterium GW2011_GWB1_31_29]KKP31690.1 MAG: hypothetical protein UR21_C0006G0005 [Candidatus Woesebacteria 